MKNHAPPPPRASTTTAAMMIMIIIFFLPPPVATTSTLGSAFILGFAFKSTSATCGNGSRRHYVIIGKDCAAGYVEKRAEGRLTRGFPCVTGKKRQLTGQLCVAGATGWAMAGGLRRPGAGRRPYPRSRNRAPAASIWMSHGQLHKMAGGTISRAARAGTAAWCGRAESSASGEGVDRAGRQAPHRRCAAAGVGAAVASAAEAGAGTAARARTGTRAAAVAGHGRARGLVIETVALLRSAGRDGGVAELDAGVAHHVVQLGHGRFQRLANFRLVGGEGGAGLAVGHAQHHLQRAEVGRIQVHGGGLVAIGRHEDDLLAQLLVPRAAADAGAELVAGGGVDCRRLLGGGERGLRAWRDRGRRGFFRHDDGWRRRVASGHGGRGAGGRRVGVDGRRFTPSDGCKGVPSAAVGLTAALWSPVSAAALAAPVAVEVVLVAASILMSLATSVWTVVLVSAALVADGALADAVVAADVVAADVAAAAADADADATAAAAAVAAASAGAL